MARSCKHHGIVCNFKARPGEDKCILHSDDPDKGADDFKESLSLHRSNCGEDFRFMVFPDEIDFRGETFKEKAYFDGAVFKDHTLFMSSKFKEDVSFRRATFEGEAFFMDSDFEEKADFWKATFKKKVDFSNSSYEENHAKGRRISNFESATLRGETIFKNTTFKCAAIFSEVNFRDGALFEEANFEGDSSFWDATFNGYTNFSRSNFERWVSFEFAQFTRAFFINTTFEGGASFECAFQQGNHVQFAQVSFTDSEFGDDVLFVGDKHSDQVFADGDVNFKAVVVGEEATLHFRYADLSNCQFLRTDLRSAVFTGVKWHEDVSSDGWLFEEWFSRVGLYDEVYQQNQKIEDDETGEGEKSEVDSPPWSEIERLYRQLKRNYEGRGDFPRGGDFHMGEKIARRKRAWKNLRSNWGVWLLLSSYRALNKYGERALPTTFWLLGLIPALALFYFLLGASTCTLCESVSYPEALLSSLEATFYPVRPVGFQNFWPQLLSIIQRVASPAIIALLALALRQRVKR